MRLSSLLLVVWVLGSSVFADDHESPATRYFPETTVAYLEIRDPSAIISTIVDHPVAAKIQSMDAWKKATQEKGYRSFLAGRKYFEAQFGGDWRGAIEAVTAGGVFAAYDEQTQGFAALVHGKDAETMDIFRSRILELTRLNANNSEVPEPYRDLPVYRIEKGGAIVVGEWLLLTNNAELGKQIVDRILDDANAGERAGTLEAVDEFEAAREQRPADAVAWGFLNLNALRKNNKLQEALNQQTENPLAELLVGGIQSVLKNSPHLTASLMLTQTRLDLQVESPVDATWIPEPRSFYFGEQLTGKAMVLPPIPGTIFTLGTHRDVSRMWLHAGDLFNEQMNDQLAEADSSLSTIFSGKDFGEDILGSFEPSFGIIVARQSFEDVKPAPAIRLPSFALVANLRDADTMRPDLRRMFQNAIGFFNIVGAQNGNPQLEMDMKKEGDVDMITSRYLPEKKDAESTSAGIVYNFTPTVAFRGNTFVLSSTQQLAENIAAAERPKQDASANTSLQLVAAPLMSTLEDNREQLISQNMLQEGHSREEAEAAIATVLELVGCMKTMGLDLKCHDQVLRLSFHIETDVEADAEHDAKR